MQKNKQWICYFIALFIFLSGMCFDTHGADSLFLRSSMSGTTYSDLSGKSMTAVEVRAEEIAGTNRTARIIGIQNQSIQQVRRNLRLQYNYLLAIASIILVLKIYMSEESVFLENADCRKSVLNYIHNTDGKKRI